MTRPSHSRSAYQRRSKDTAAETSVLNIAAASLHAAHQPSRITAAKDRGRVGLWSATWGNKAKGVCTVRSRGGVMDAEQRRGAVEDSAARSGGWAALPTGVLLPELAEALAAGDCATARLACRSWAEALAAGRRSLRPCRLPDSSHPGWERFPGLRALDLGRTAAALAAPDLARLTPCSSITSLGLAGCWKVRVWWAGAGCWGSPHRGCRMARRSCQYWLPRGCSGCRG